MVALLPLFQRRRDEWPNFSSFGLSSLKPLRKIVPIHFLGQLFTHVLEGDPPPIGGQMGPATVTGPCEAAIQLEASRDCLQVLN
jgi:hypothetical protein